MHVKNNINQGRFYIQGLRSFKDSLPKDVKKILDKRGHIYSEILSRWNYLVGKEMSKISFPKTFKPSLKNGPGTLTISVQRGNEVEIEYSKNIIINNIRIETFNTFVKSINNKKIFISQKSAKKIANSLKEIKNEKIKKSLIQLLKAIKK